MNVKTRRFTYYEEKTMSLMAFYLLYYTFACLLRHFHGFNLSLSRVEPFSRSCRLWEFHLNKASYLFKVNEVSKTRIEKLLAIHKLSIPSRNPYQVMELDVCSRDFIDKTSR